MRELDFRLDALVAQVERVVSAHAAAEQAAAAIAIEAKERFEKEYRFNTLAWTRPLDQLNRLDKLEQEIGKLDRKVAEFGERYREREDDPEARADIQAQTAEVSEARRKAHEEHERLCDTLGMDTAPGDPDRKVIRWSAEVAEGVPAGDSDRPEDWVVPRLGLELCWDPDYYVALTTERHLESRDLMLAASDGPLRLAWSLLLAHSRDRGVLMRVLVAGDVASEVAGRTATLNGLIPSRGVSPVRWWLTNKDWPQQFDPTPAREEFRVVSRDGRNAREAVELAEYVTTIERANLDAHLLQVGGDILTALGVPPSETSASTQSGSEARVVPEGREAGPDQEDLDTSGWKDKKQVAYQACRLIPKDEWIDELTAEGWGLSRPTFRSWLPSLEKNDQRHTAGGIAEIKQVALLKRIEAWRAR